MTILAIYSVNILLFIFAADLFLFFKAPNNNKYSPSFCTEQFFSLSALSAVIMQIPPPWD